MGEIASHSHGGWDVHMHIVPPGVVAANESCRYVMQVAPLDGVRRFYVDSLMHPATFLESLIKLVGEDKILLGCDWLFSMGLRMPTTISAHSPRRYAGKSERPTRQKLSASAYRIDGGSK